MAEEISWYKVKSIFDKRMGARVKYFVEEWATIFSSCVADAQKTPFLRSYRREWRLALQDAEEASRKAGGSDAYIKDAHNVYEDAFFDSAECAWADAIKLLQPAIDRYRLEQAQYHAAMFARRHAEMLGAR